MLDRWYLRGMSFDWRTCQLISDRRPRSIKSRRATIPTRNKCSPSRNYARKKASVVSRADKSHAPRHETIARVRYKSGLGSPVKGDRFSEKGCLQIARFISLATRCCCCCCCSRCWVSRIDASRDRTIRPVVPFLFCVLA